MHIISPIRTQNTITTLTCLWEASVRQSHHFLTDENIEKLRPFVKTGLESIEQLYVSFERNLPTGFIGIDKDKIEMLFVAPEHLGKGIGKRLVTMACQKSGAKYVDVNEQNPKAEAFYRHMGFRTFERTETDEQGNPFPILKMKLETAP